MKCSNERPQIVWQMRNQSGHAEQAHWYCLMRLKLAVWQSDLIALPQLETTGNTEHSRKLSGWALPPLRQVQALLVFTYYGLLQEQITSEREQAQSPEKSRDPDFTEHSPGLQQYSASPKTLGKESGKGCCSYCNQLAVLLILWGQQSTMGKEYGEETNWQGCNHSLQSRKYPQM